MKVLLLNPPGKQNYLRDYYCTSISKSDYYYHPIDLLYLSGTLSLEHDVFFLEALRRGLSKEETIQEIRRINPQALICLVAAPSFEEDSSFLRDLHNQLPQVHIVGTGDIFREYREKMFDVMPFLTATLVDFSTDDILRYLQGPQGNTINNVIYRHNSHVIVGPEKHGHGQFSIPTPCIDLFEKRYYTFPFVRHEPFMSVLSDFGCPYGCTFCPISTLGFKMRPIEEVIAELKRIWETGYREVHFRDQTFAVNKERSLKLCEAIKNALPDLTWSCFSRVDVLDEDRVQAMAQSGCHTVIVGIEFDNDQMQKLLKKNINRHQMINAIKICHKHKLNVAGTFILGLPDDDEEAILRTSALSQLLDLDFASFNLATPRLGSTWRRQLLDDDRINEKDFKMDTVKGTESFKRAKLNQQQLRQLRLKIEHDFYLRPEYILNRVRKLRSLAEFKTLLRNGFSILHGG
ncbi:MAG: radical SAM protein [Planctomycetes bacterium]|nr:radical SAM protein [Planctomycetota bacterium]